MKLSQLLQGIDCVIPQDNDITNLTNDSRKASAGCLYIAIHGSALDGHQYAESACQNGATAVLVERDLKLENQIIVPDTKQAYAIACANFFGRPADTLTLIGVTGTNGKTSVTTMIQTILQQQGMVAGLIGTIHIDFPGHQEDSKNTTPDAYQLHQVLAQMKAAGCRYVVMEVSSHALAQERLYGLHFAVAAFTNLTQDHLDFHADMDDYFAAKCKLFAMTDQRIFNIHDPHGALLLKRYPDATSFSIEGDQASYTVSDLQCDPAKVSFVLRHGDLSTKVQFAVPGRYSAENALTAIAVCRAVGVCIHQSVTTLGQMTGINGRCEVLFENTTMTVIRDYAHSPDGVDNILSSVKQYTKGRVVAVFGCGGDRDVTKRPIMAAIAAKHADFLVVTSDNPRSEDPDAIVAQVVAGVPAGTDHVVIVDRTQAIRYAMTHAQPGDVILLLGKGHETYQILKDRTIHFDEKEVVADIAQTL